MVANPMHMLLWNGINTGKGAKKGMDATRADSTSAEHHEYRPVRYGRLILCPLLFLLIWLLWSPITNVLILHTPIPRGGLILMAFTLPIVLLAGIALVYFHIITVRKLRLITMPQGILFQGPGYRIYAPWDALVGLGKMPRNGPMSAMIFIPTEGVTFQPPTQAMSLNEGREQHRPAVEAIDPRNAGRYRFSRATMIPVGYFVRDWESDPVAQDIRQYAPQVFATPSR